MRGKWGPFPFGAEPSASWLSGAALVLTAIGGVITAIAGFRRPRTGGGSAPTSEQIWVETLYQLDLAAAERDSLTARVADLEEDLRRERNRRDASEAEASGWRRQYEQANAELIALLRKQDKPRDAF